MSQNKRILSIFSVQKVRKRKIKIKINFINIVFRKKKLKLVEENNFETKLQQCIRITSKIKITTNINQLNAKYDHKPLTKYIGD